MKVNGPNGITINFPDGTDPQTIDKVMREAVGKTQPRPDPGPNITQADLMGQGVQQPQPDTYSRRSITDLVTGGPKGRPGAWGEGEQALSTILGDAPKKMNAAIYGLGNAAYGAATGDGWDYSTPYNRALEQQRADEALFNQDHPYRSAAGTVGGLGLGITSMPVKGAGWKGAAETGAMYGAFGGATQDANTLSDRISNTGLGALVGTGIGAGGYGLGTLAAAGAKKAGQVLGLLGADPQTKAAAQFWEAANKVSLPPNLLAQKSSYGPNLPNYEIARRALGPEAMPVDVLGKQGIALGRGAANMNPAARETIEGAVLGRKAGQNQRLASTLEKAAKLPIGNTKDVEALKAADKAARQPAITKAYEIAYAQGHDVPIDYFDNVLSTQQGEAAFKEAVQNVWAREQVRGAKHGGNLAVIDEMKKILDSKANVAFRAGDTATGSMYADLSKNLRFQMDVVLAQPVYKQARALAEKAYKSGEAFDLGAELGKGRVGIGTPGKVAKVDPQYRPNVAKAYAAKKTESLLNRQNTEGALNEFTSLLGRQASDAALGPGAPLLAKQLQREKAYNVTTKELTGNSSTVRQLLEAAGTGVVTSALGSLAGYDPTTSLTVGGLAALGRKAIPTIAQKLVTEHQRKVAPFLAEILTSYGIPKTGPIPPGFLERYVTAGDEKLAKTLTLIWQSELQKNSRQTVPANQ